MLEIEGVCRSYRPPTGVMRSLLRAAVSSEVRALDDVTLHAHRGRIHGLVGPNGAGKTTLIRIVSGLLSPDSGKVRIAGTDPTADRRSAGRKLGLVLADDRSLYWRLTGRQNLEFHGILHGLSKRVAKDRADRLLSEFGLGDRDRLVFGYSTGMRAKLGIARALVHDPPVIVLDEPTRSLDPIAATEVCVVLEQLATAGRTVVLSSHRLEELERIAHDVSVIIGGRIRYSGRMTGLRTDGSTVATVLEAMLSEDQYPASDVTGTGQ